jgi:hypothetical protein
LLSAAKKVGRHKSSQFKGLCLETRLQVRINGAFGLRKTAIELNRFAVGKNELPLGF